MKKAAFAAILLLASSCLFLACDDTTETIGTSLTDDLDRLTISSDTFNVSTRSILADSVFSRSTIGYLGRIKDPETNDYITGDFMVQFHTMENYEFPEKEKILSKLANGEIIADSCEISLFYDDFYGDSLATMKATVYEMGTPMEEGIKYYSNYDPMANGHIRNGGIRQEKVYTLTDHSISDSLRAASDYLPSLRIPLNSEYTDKDGKTYNNYGTYIMQKYYENAGNFKNSYAFIHNVCPGFYIKAEEGLGSMAYISISWISVYFKMLDTDGEEHIGVARFTGTEEVMQATHITNDLSTLRQLAGDPTCTYIKSPAGIFTEMTMPVDEIIANHENDTLNTAKIQLTRILNKQHGDFTLSTPSKLLMIERDSMYSFFENAKTVDKKTSFTSTTSGNRYVFNNVAGLLRHIYEAKKKGMASDPQWTEKHPNWNKVVLIPVKEKTSTTSTVSRISHDMSLSSTRLVGGSQNASGDIPISVIYSKFTNKR